MFCEDEDGFSEKLLNVALQELRPTFPAAAAVEAIGAASKNDVKVRIKFARLDKVRAFGVRDRDFLERGLVERAREQAFADTPGTVEPWPLSRHCMESYLLDDDILLPTLPHVAPDELLSIVENLAKGRRWLDVARGTLEDLTFRLRKLERVSIELEARDRDEALRAVREAAERIRAGMTSAFEDDLLAQKLDSLHADVVGEGRPRDRADGKALLGALEAELGKRGLLAGGVVPNGLRRALVHQAHRHPPAALLADIRLALSCMPPRWVPPAALQ